MKKLALTLALLAPPAAAQDADAFVEANVLSIFYHELGHALIDVMGLPVFGQEEDAADTASILLIDSSFDEQTAVEIATDAALGFYAEAETNDGDVAWWDEHGADLQRYYNLVCLFYGANPEARDDFAEDMGLPEERTENCPDEYTLAIDSWGPVFDELLDAKPADSLTLVARGNTVMTQTLRDEVAALNKEISLPVPVTVKVENCNEANAFYDPGLREITMCTEFEAHLRTLAAEL